METLDSLNAIQADIRAKLGTLVEALPDGIAIVNADGVIVFANRRLHVLSGYGADELVGRPVERLVPDHLAGAHQTHRGHFRTEPEPRAMGADLSVFLRRKDGSKLPIDVQLSGVDIGNVPYVLASVRDMTQRAASDEALRQSAQRFRSFVEAAPVMMFSLWPDGVIQSVNRELEMRTGWRRQDLIGTHFAPLVHPDDLADAMSALDKVVHNQVIDDHELRIRTVGGDYLLTEATVVPLASDGQGVAEMIGVVHDVSRQRATEEELRAAKERFRQAFKQGPLGMALIDCDARITNVNNALCRLVGYTKEELVGKPFHALLHPDDVAADAALSQQLDTGDIPSYQVEQRYVTKDGEEVSGVVTASVIFNDHGKPLYGMRTVEDITEEVKFERELASHAAIAKNKLATLTRREHEVLELLNETVTASELAAQLFVSARTVESHLASAYRKLGVRTRAEAHESYGRMKHLVERFDPHNPAAVRRRPPYRTGEIPVRP